MGQYWKPICIDSFEWLYSHEYNSNGLKLMEHSWIGNDFVGIIMKLLTKGNSWDKKRVVWAGDYSEKVFKDNTLYSMGYDDEDEEGIRLFKKINPKDCLTEEEQKSSIIVNHTKKEYVKLSECKSEINPLPLLTALGNNRGGGDYRGKNMNLIGRWAFDEISVEFDDKELKDYKKLTPEFEEGLEDEISEENEKVAYEKIKKWLKTKEVKKMLVVARL